MFVILQSWILMMKKWRPNWMKWVGSCRLFWIVRALPQKREAFHEEQYQPSIMLRTNIRSNNRKSISWNKNQLFNYYEVIQQNSHNRSPARTAKEVVVRHTDSQRRMRTCNSIGRNILSLNYYKLQNLKITFYFSFAKYSLQYS